MKHEIVTIAVIFVIMAAMMGIASAQDVQSVQGGQGGIGGGCPGRNSLGSHTQTYDYLSADKTTSGSVVTYILNTVNNGALVIGYCVYPTPGFEGSVGDLTPLVAGWAIWPNNANKDYFGFQRGNGGNEIHIDGTTGIQMGTADYEESGLPESEVILFHINDPEECGSTGDSENGNDNTCWRRPGSAPPPVPELSTIALTSAGILGLFLIVRKYRKN